MEPQNAIRVDVIQFCGPTEGWEEPSLASFGYGTRALVLWLAGREAEARAELERWDSALELSPSEAARVFMLGPISHVAN